MDAPETSPLLAASPLLDVAGKPVFLSDLVGVSAVDPETGSPDTVISSYLRAVLERTAGAIDPVRAGDSDTPGGEFRPVRLHDVARTLLLHRDTPPLDVLPRFYGALNGPGVPPTPKIAPLDPEKPLPPEQVAGAVLGGDVTAVLAEAARHGAELRTLRRGMVGLRHATLALLTTVEGREMLWWEGLVEGEPSEVMPALSRGLAADLAANDFFQDDPDGWHVLLDRAALPDPAPRLPRPTRVSQDSYVPDRPVERIDQDQLGFADEARALARVIALREPGPPLAVGLFGDWGSGKSSFMNMLEDAVEQIALQSREDETAGAVFVGNVVHIRFNAWVYNDTDLWSSLTSECFRQLREGGSKHRQAEALQGVLAQLSRHVQAASGTARAADTQLSGKRAERDALRQAVARQEADAARTRAGFVASAAIATVDELGAARVHDALAALGVQTGDRKPAETADRLKLEVERAADFSGQLGAFATVLVRAASFSGPGAKWFWGSLALGVAALLFVPWAISEGLGNRFSATADGVATWARAMLAALVAALPLARLYRLVEPVLRAGSRFHASYAESRRAADEQLREDRKKLHEADAEIARLTAERDAATAQAARFRDADPSDVLDFFLNHGDQTRSFEANLGVVSRVRDVFEQLDGIIRNGRETGTAPIDRIVLYIDDLDRCRAETVVSVLEAVHLLLAMDLFVVVVGVDQRWLASALRERLHLGQAAGGLAGTATPKDYLEKIFQIPIRLGRLRTTSDAFGAYVDSIAGPRESAAAAPQAAAPPEAAEGGPTTLSPAEVTLPPLHREAEESAEAVLLREHEIQLAKELGPLMGRSPRAVKKFVNLYRLIRGMRRGDALERFLSKQGGGPDDGPAEACHVGVQFWLAVDCGLGSAQVQRLRGAVARADDSATVASVLERIASTGSSITPDTTARPEIHAFWADVPEARRDELWSAFEAVDRRLTGPLAMAGLRQAMVETERFSSF